MKNINMFVRFVEIPFFILFFGFGLYNAKDFVEIAGNAIITCKFFHFYFSSLDFIKRASYNISCPLRLGLGLALCQ